MLRFLIEVKIILSSCPVIVGSKPFLDDKMDDFTGNERKIESAVSFGFTKKQETKQLVKSAVSDTADGETNNEPDYVLSLEGKQVKSSKSRSSKQEYVIPLIKRNQWRKNDVEKTAKSRSGELEKGRNYDDLNDTNNLDEIAAKEILIETQRYNEDWDERGAGDSHSSVSIPLLMQNKIPDGFEDDNKLDVVLRPDVPDDADYEQIPIEHFGMAMLRGMGWNKERGIGKNGQVIVPIEAQLRPKGLGLGADRNNSGQGKQKDMNVGDKDSEVLDLKKNSYCLVTGGAHKGLYGVVEGLDEDNARIMLKLSLSGKTVNIMQCYVNVVNKKEYDKYSKYLNKEKADSYKQKEEEKMKNGHSHENGHSEYTSRKRNADLDEDNVKDYFPKKAKKSKKSKKGYRDSPESHHHKRHKKSLKKQKSSSDDDSDVDSNCAQSILTFWLRNDLKIRIIDKSLHKGKYYKEKAVIVDVSSPGVCVCRTYDGKVISDVPQSSLETVIPRSDDDHVAIVSGSHIGQIGKVMKRDKEKGLALVQLLSDRDIVLRLGYDDICEYVGDVHDRDDY